MEFFVYDLAFLAAFCLFVIFFLKARKNKIKREGILFLYRTKKGLRFIDRTAKKFDRFWKNLAPVSIVFGFLMMIAILVLLIWTVFFTIKTPTNIPPIMPLLPYVPQLLKIPMPPFYFTYWIVILAIVAITHEFSHGIFARANKIKVKSTGFGFLGPFLLAFVEPDEKQMSRKSKKTQLAVFSAGSFSNLVFAIIFVLIMQLFFVVAYQPAGISNYVFSYSGLNLNEVKTIGNYTAKEFFDLSNKELYAINKTLEVKTENNTYYLDASLIQSIPLTRKTINKYHLIVAYDDSPAFRANLSGGIIAVDNQSVHNAEQIREIISAHKPNETIQIMTSENIYDIKLAKSKNDSSKGYLGIGFIQLTGIRKLISSATSPFFSPYLHAKAKGNEQIAKFFQDLLWWLVIICFFVALFNMLPLGFLDGGRFLYIAALALTKSKKGAERIFRVFSYIVLIIFLMLIFSWLI